MKNRNTIAKPKGTEVIQESNGGRIEKCKKMGDHLLAAAANHFKAAFYLKNGNHRKADEHITLAKDQLDLMSEAYGEKPDTTA